MALSIFEKHQLKIARSTMKMHCIGASISGVNHYEAKKIIKSLTNKTVLLEPYCSCGAM